MRLLLYTIVLLVCLSCTATAQIVTRSGEIYGRVTDEKNFGLPNVLVTLESIEITTQTSTSGPEGYFRFIDLPPGFYNLNFVLVGFSELRHEQIRVITGGHVELAIAMKQSLEEKITIVGEADFLDRKKTGISFVYTEEYLEQVPNGRDPWFVLGMTPGVDSARLNTGTGSVFQSNFFGRGDSFGNNTWHYDGIDHTDPKLSGNPPSYYDFEAFEEIQITTGGVDVSIQTGGIGINLVTKRGGNKWTGSASLFGNSETLDYGFHAGGPLIKDKFFVWGGYRFLNDQTEEDLIVRESSNIKDINAKISLTWNDAHSTQIGYLRGERRVQDRDLAENSAPEALVDVSSRPDAGIWTFEQAWVPNDRTLLTARYGLLLFGSAVTPNGGIDVPMIHLLPINRIENTVWLIDPDSRTVHDINIDGNHFKENLLGADHEFRFGFEYRTSDLHIFSTYGAGVLITDFYQTTPNGPLTFGSLWAQNAVNAKMTIQNQSAYFSDTIRKQRFTLSLGIRYDYQTGKNRPSEVFGVPGFEEFVKPFSYEGGDPGIGTHDFSPRMGMTYALTEDNKTLLKANYARYYDAFNTQQFTQHSNPTAIYNGAFFYYENSNNDRIITPDEFVEGPYYFGDNTGNQFSLDAFFASRIYDSDLGNAWTNEWIVGIEREIKNDFYLGSTLTMRRYGNFLRVLPYGVTTDDYVPGGVFEASTPLGNFSVPYFVLGYQHDGTAILSNIKDYEQSYRGLDIFLQKRMKNNFLFNAFFTIQSQAGHYDGGDSLAIQTEQNRNVGATYPFDPTNLPFLQEQPYSYASSSLFGSRNPFSEWSLKFSGVYTFPSDISMGVFLRYQQGYPMVLFAFVPDDSLQAFYGTGGHAILVEPIGSRRYDDIFTADFQIQKSFDFGRIGRLTGILTIFNVTNQQAVTNRARIVNFNNLNDVLGELDERSFRFGLRYSF